MSPTSRAAQDIVVSSGRRTGIVDLVMDRNVARGRVITEDGGIPVDRGSVVVTVQRGRKVQREVRRSGKVFSDGRFAIVLNLQRENERESVLKAMAFRMQADYLDSVMFADCDSEISWAKV